jgi:hypothetical protein
MNGPVFKGESDRFSEAQLEMHRAALRWQTDQQLREAYEIYRGKLALDGGRRMRRGSSTSSPPGTSCGGGRERMATSGLHEDAPGLGCSKAA